MSTELANPMGITPNHYKEEYIQEFIFRWITEKKSKSEAYALTFDCDQPLEQCQRTTLSRWMRKEEVQKWIKKADKALQIDWLDKRANGLEMLYNIGMNEDENTRNRIDAMDKFLNRLDKDQNKLMVDFGGSQVNIVQIVQDKLAAITQGATIQPDIISKEDYIKRVEYVDSIVNKEEKQNNLILEPCTSCGKTVYVHADNDYGDILCGKCSGRIK